MSNLNKIDEYMRNYENSLRKMNDNRLHVEFHFVSNNINTYSGKPLRWKICAVRDEAKRRGLV